MKECCKNCRYCRDCKQLVNGKWERFRICMLFADDADGFALVVHDNDMCECLKKKYVKVGWVNVTVMIYIKGDKHPNQMLTEVDDFEVNESFLIVKSIRWRAIYNFLLRDIIGFKVELMSFTSNDFVNANISTEADGSNVYITNSTTRISKNKRINCENIRRMSFKCNSGFKYRVRFFVNSGALTYGLNYATVNAQAEVNAAQAVYNATNGATVATIHNQVAQLMAMTKLVIPSDNVCPKPMPEYNSWTAPT